MTSIGPSTFRTITSELTALSRSRHPDTGSWKAVKQAILQAATSLRAETGQESPPIGLEKIEKLRRVQKKIVYDSDSASGAILEPVQGGFVIRLGRDQSTIRRRFGIAHEIGHTFFYNLDHDPPVKVLPRGSSRVLAEKKEEDICNAFARELLVPEDLIRQDIAISSDRNLKTMIDLAAKYMVSPEVIARRLVLDFTEFPTSVVLFKDFGAVRGKTVWWFYGSRLRRYIRKEEKAIFERVVQTIQMQSGCEDMEPALGFNNKMVKVECYQSMPNARLMAVVTFRRDEEIG